MTVAAPSGLGTRGRRLWRDVTGENELDGSQRVVLEEACRTADRLDKLDALLRGEVDEWIRFSLPKGDGEELTLRIDGALAEARQQATVLKQLLAALRLPDEAGNRPQHRGARGSYKPSGKAASVSSLDRARSTKSGA